MRVDDIFPPEVIDEDIRKWMGGALVAGAVAAAPMGFGNVSHAENDFLKKSVAQDISILAQTMWGEARSHGPVGMLAVGSVIKNRAESDRGLTFGHGIKGVALKNKQFSCWNQGDPNREKMKEMREIDKAIRTKTPPEGDAPFDEWFQEFKTTQDYADYTAWREAFVIAGKIMKNQVQDPTHGAYFYHTTAVHPRWAIGAEPISKVANHVFYQKVN